MDHTQMWGVALVVLAGLCMGSGGWPIKLLTTFRYEQFAFLGTLISQIITWVIVLVFCPHAFAAYGTVDPSILIRSNLFSLLWGVANILCLLCFIRIGFSLTGGILTGIGVSVGVITPMIFKASGLFKNAPDLFSPAGYTVLIGVAVMLIGVVLVSIAGHQRHRAGDEAAIHRGGFGLGLFMVILAGVLSAGISFSFVYSQGPIVAAMKAQGAGDIAANFAVWAVGLAAGLLINLLYPAYLLTVRKSWHVLGSPRQIFYCAIMAVNTTVAMVLMGKGMIMLGVLGASIGFGVQQAMQMLGGQAVGFISGEWRGVARGTLLIMIAAIFLLILAAAIMSYGNTLVAPNP